MGLYSDPPPAQLFSEAKPTLLVAWWITIFCTCLVLLRLAGRYIRIEKLFLEDKIAALSLLPLYLRMACVHVVLLYGTNNVQLIAPVGEDELRRRAIGSRVVLAARIFFAATLWVLKLTSLEFMNRIAVASVEKFHSRLILVLKCFLGATFLAAIISDLAECQPITKYDQVLPDPGPQCRQGYVQLLTAGVCGALIDTILVIIPIPIVLSLRISVQRKILLVMLFCLGLLTVGITVYRIHVIVEDRGSQITRSAWASVELLAATAFANLVPVGSFLRDSGAKKKRFRPSRSTSGASSSQRKFGSSSMDDYDIKFATALDDDLDTYVDTTRDWDPYQRSDDLSVNGQGHNRHRSPWLDISPTMATFSPTGSHDSLILHTHHPNSGGAGAGSKVGGTPKLIQPRPVLPAKAQRLR